MILLQGGTQLFVFYLLPLLEPACSCLLLPLLYLSLLQGNWITVYTPFIVLKYESGEVRKPELEFSFSQGEGELERQTGQLGCMKKRVAAKACGAERNC